MSTFSIMGTFVIQGGKCFKTLIRFISFSWKASIFDLMSNQNVITESKERFYIKLSGII